MKVLIVDDNQEDRLLVQRELSRHYPVASISAVGSSIDFRSALQGPPADVVITDFQLRWTNGLDVLDEVRRRWPDCAIVMFTSTGTQEIAVHAMKLGLDDYVIKAPAHFVRLPAAVEFALQRRRAIRGAGQDGRRLDALLADIGVGVFRLAVDGTLREANPAFLRLVGLSSLEEAAGLSFIEFVSPATKEITWRRPGAEERRLRVRTHHVDEEGGALIEGVAAAADGSGPDTVPAAPARHGRTA